VTRARRSAPRGKPGRITIRPATPSDLPFLKLMWFEAAFWDPATPRPSMEQALAIPELARYIQDWGRPGDAALIATDDRPVGAAWYRLFRSDDRGYGFVDENTPELGIGMTLLRRGEGVGARLLDALCDRASSDGFSSISLSVVKKNPSVRLYERAGFVVVGSDESSWKMVKRLGA
jgi:RimJ/RimL family protein N-acetyltransferase